ncbi:MAG: hypothetical protein HZB99_02570 [Candidatus Harrisonbacteria bacterium]|nr:hypothetical protein [Candidatus Harrisonbacteria bacterium]
MALDSTGFGDRREIPCFICNGDPLKFRVYRPDYGHGGQSLDARACIEPHWPPLDAKLAEKLSNARLFEIRPMEVANPTYSGEKLNPQPPVQFVETELRQSHYPYHYGGLVMPDFGESVGQTIYVCPNCVKVEGDETLDEKLDHAFIDKIDKKIFELLWGLAKRTNALKILAQSKSFRKRWRGVDKRERVRISKLFGTLINNFKNANPVRAGQGLRLLRNLESVLR